MKGLQCKNCAYFSYHYPPHTLFDGLQQFEYDGDCHAFEGNTFITNSTDWCDLPDYLGEDVTAEDIEREYDFWFAQNSGREFK